MTDTVNMTFDEWVEEFEPRQNHFDDNAAFEGLMFETFGAEFDYVQAQKSNYIWTIAEEDGQFYIGEGLNFVNRMGYAVTKNSSVGNTIYVVVDDDISPS